MDREILFIGGVLDGQRRIMRDGVERWNAHAPTGESSRAYQQYTRQVFTGRNGKRHELYVLTSPEDVDGMTLLVEGYRKPLEEVPRETLNERFERLAMNFWNDTGMMAPGKDALNHKYSAEERTEAWTKWLKEREGAKDND